MAFEKTASQLVIQAASPVTGQFLWLAPGLPGCQCCQRFQGVSKMEDGGVCFGCGRGIRKSDGEC